MNVNSYTLFGDHNRYAAGVATNLRQHLTMYRGWEFRLHVDRVLDLSGYGRVIVALASDGLLRLHTVPEQVDPRQRDRGRVKGAMMLWRMLPVWETHVDAVFCRDLDSVLTPRQLKCVRAFLALPPALTIAHGINDNVSHNIPLMGGMCGFRTASFHRAFGGQTLSELMAGARVPVWDRQGADQDFLTRAIWPAVAGHSVIDVLHGPNRRSHLKHPIVGSVDVSDVPALVLNHGDDFSNYIGAAGNSASDREIAAFYDAHGDPRCRRVAEVERACGWEWKDDDE